MSEYKGWQLLESMPDGWSIDKTVGSPIHGYDFVTNGKSVINGQKRALLRVVSPPFRLVLEHKKADIKLHVEDKKIEKKPSQVIDAVYARTVNELARQKFKQRILGDILVDLTICEIEGWGKLEYISELRNLINSIGQNHCIDVAFSKMETATSFQNGNN